jgi:hypothetical protein
LIKALTFPLKQVIIITMKRGITWHIRYIRQTRSPE